MVKYEGQETSCVTSSATKATKREMQKHILFDRVSERMKEEIQVISVATVATQLADDATQFTLQYTEANIALYLNIDFTLARRLR